MYRCGKLFPGTTRDHKLTPRTFHLAEWPATCPPKKGSEDRRSSSRGAIRTKPQITGGGVKGNTYPTGGIAKGKKDSWGSMSPTAQGASRWTMEETLDSERLARNRKGGNPTIRTHQGCLKRGTTTGRGKCNQNGQQEFKATLEKRYVHPRSCDPDGSQGNERKRRETNVVLNWGVRQGLQVEKFQADALNQPYKRTRRLVRRFGPTRKLGQNGGNQVNI